VRLPEFRGWPRRLLALALLVVAGVSALHATKPGAAAEPTAALVVAAHELVPGATIAAGDLRVVNWPVSLRPAAAVAAGDAVGRTLAGAVGAGEVITSFRLVGRDLSAGLPPGLIAVPVPLVDAGALGLIRAGNHVDLLSPPGDPGGLAVVVASNVLVLAILPRSADSSSGNAQLVVAVDQPTELRIAQVITSPLLATLIKSP
jgi:pilus assembly protein CpaB